MSFSTIPDVLDALLAKATAALPATVQVIDGQPITTEGDFMAIGYTGVPGDEAVVSVRTREQLTAMPDRETYDVTCIASTWQGDDDPRAVRVRLFDQIGALAAELAADPKLGGLVLRARLSLLSYAPEQTEDGTQANARFAINVDAFARP
jgi:hypothetical protein